MWMWQNSPRLNNSTFEPPTEKEHHVALKHTPSSDDVTSLHAGTH